MTVHPYWFLNVALQLSIPWTILQSLIESLYYTAVLAIQKSPENFIPRCDNLSANFQLGDSFNYFSFWNSKTTLQRQLRKLSPTSWKVCGGWMNSRANRIMWSHLAIVERKCTDKIGRYKKYMWNAVLWVWSFARKWLFSGEIARFLNECFFVVSCMQSCRYETLSPLLYRQQRTANKYCIDSCVVWKMKRISEKLDVFAVKCKIDCLITHWWGACSLTTHTKRRQAGFQL